MGLSGALNTSLNGLRLNETAISVISNNIANAETIGFKASEVTFKTQLSQTLSAGSAPTLGDSGTGGTNPMQIGLGAAVSSINKDFTQGGITNSTNESDLALQGSGFFILKGPSGIRYTRNGSFATDSANRLVNADGMRVQGYAVDSSFNILRSSLGVESLSDLEIPLNNLNIAEATQLVTVGGAIFAQSTAEIGTQGAIVSSDTLYYDNSGSIDPLSGIVDPVTHAEENVLLSDIRVSDGSGGYDTPFLVNDTIDFSTRKGQGDTSREVESQTLSITATTTLGDFLTFIDETIGIHEAGTAGVRINASGEIEIEGNIGTVNDIPDLKIGDFTASDGVTTRVIPITWTQDQNATGESTAHSVAIYDSQGEAIDLRISTVLDQANPVRVRYFVESYGDSRSETAIQTGTLEFGTDNYVLPSQAEHVVEISRSTTGAVDPLSFTLDFSQLMSIASDSSSLVASADGFPPGTLTDFSIDESGIINGAFDNGYTRPLGQLALAMFSNEQGLMEAGDNTYVQGVTAGDPNLNPPGTFGYATILGGAIELSNTDVGGSLVDLITMSTNYRGNARVISSVNQLMDELLLLGR